MPAIQQLYANDLPLKPVAKCSRPIVFPAGAKNLSLCCGLTDSISIYHRSRHLESLTPCIYTGDLPFVSHMFQYFHHSEQVHCMVAHRPFSLLPLLLKWPSVPWLTTFGFLPNPMSPDFCTPLTPGSSFGGLFYIHQSCAYSRVSRCRVDDLCHSLSSHVCAPVPPLHMPYLLASCSTPGVRLSIASVPHPK